MKSISLALALAATLGAAPSFAEPMASNMKMSSPTAAAAKTAQGAGVVTSIDAPAQKITIAHQPIAALGWPAMTMSFTADSAALLKTAKIGDHVSFSLRLAESGPKLIALKPQ